MSFITKGIDIIAQKTQHLAFGNHQANAVQNLHDPVGRHLSLMMLQQNETKPFSPEMPVQAGRQWRHKQLALRRQPPFSSIADHPAFKTKLLNHEIVIPLEPRARRRVH